MKKKSHEMLIFNVFASMARETRERRKETSSIECDMKIIIYEIALSANEMFRFRCPWVDFVRIFYSKFFKNFILIP